MAQLSLFGKRPLFDESVLRRRRSEWASDPIQGFDRAAAPIQEFGRQIRAARGRGKETALEQAFNQGFFVQLLGYRLYPGVEGIWTAWPKPPSSATGLEGEPDVVLGDFNLDSTDILVVVELKKPGTSLDAPQPSYDNRTPVEQAFDYAEKVPTCRWVIVSNMEVVRLYAIDTQDEYHEIDLHSDPSGRSDAIDEALRLLAHNYLVTGGNDSSTSRLLASSRDERASSRDAFYYFYGEIRSDLLAAVERWCAGRFDRTAQVLAIQRLLDRLLFIYFCEDHPDRLLPHDLVKGIVDRAVQAPGPSTEKAYDNLKMLFQDLDKGVKTPFRELPRYNGELFKPHDIVDQMQVSDDLYAKPYRWALPSGNRKIVDGVYGLHVFDFWRELDRDLLGNLFERSIGDLTAIAHGGRTDARQAFGIFYTASRLARFVATSAVNAMLADNKELSANIARAADAPADQHAAIIDQIVEGLKRYRIADLACGSGVFLTAALDTLLMPYRKALEAVSAGELAKSLLSYRQSEVLRSAIYGVDLLPQAVELAKLALWLTAARQREPSADLSSNFVVGDSLSESTLDPIFESAGGQLGLVLGNPPWGGEVDRTRAREVLRRAGVSIDGAADSWEIFVALAVTALKPGGRFALLVPDTIFSADKRRTRDWLLNHCRLERVYALGPDWFTSDIRMGTVVLQGVNERPTRTDIFATMVLAGRNRSDAQNGRRPLLQLEAALSGRITQQRCRDDEERQMPVLSSEDELEMQQRINASSRPIGDLTEHARGNEMNAEGLVWRCGNCMAYTVPGEKRRGGGYADKTCPQCGATLTARDVAPDTLISDTRRGPYQTEYIDGTMLTRRYESPLRRYLRKDLVPLLPALKRDTLFEGPKILIRQAGVGVVATLVDDNSHCPQSVIFIERPKQHKPRDIQTSSCWRAS